MAKLKLSTDGTLKCNIIDGEYDQLKCKFNSDDCVEINTKNLTYITLSKDNLYELINKIDEAKKKYDQMPKIN